MTDRLGDADPCPRNASEPVLAQRPSGVGRRLLSLVLRPTARPLGWGIAAAAGLVVAETLLVMLLKRTAPDDSYGVILLLGVMVVAAGWNLGLAVATSLVSAAVYVYFHVEDGDGPVPALLVFLPVAVLAAVLASQARVRAAESDRRRAAADAIAREQAALRHVATLVASGADPVDVYRVTVTELGRGLGVEHVSLNRFDEDEHCVILATYAADGESRQVVGDRFALDGDSVSARVHRTGSLARIDGYATTATGGLARLLEPLGLQSAVGSPVVVAGRVRGVLVVGSAGDEGISTAVEEGVSAFADLVGTAIGNAETRAELHASRARVVAAADAARRGIERDLHDGAQQRVVSLGLGLRALEASIPDGDVAEHRQVDNLIQGMADLYTELQELSRGIHPAILSKGGLGPAIKTLARRTPVPVGLELAVDRRLPDSIEVAAYYVVAEALTNVVKHARASGVTVRVQCAEDELRCDVTDDGVGGAVTGGGSGLLGLKDRVAAVSGRLEVTSSKDCGTTVSARIPVPADRHDDDETSSAPA